MNHHNHTNQNQPAVAGQNKGAGNCGCSVCESEKLAVNCGCAMEAKQYEYNLTNKLRHQEHKRASDKKVVGQPAGHSHTKNHAGHDMRKMSHMDHEMAMTNPQMAKAMEADMRRRFWISVILSIPIFLYSPVGINFFKLNLPTPISVNWLLFILTTPIVFWAGSIFITGTYYSLKNKKLNMSVLVSTGVLAAYLFSIILTVMRPGAETFYEAAALLVTFVLFGHWMEMKSRRGTSDSLRALFDLVPPQAKVLRAGKEVIISSAEIVVGDIVILKPGDKVPVDGEVVEGDSSIDESLVTGESIPVVKKINDKVIGGSINQTGAIKFKAIKVGDDTVLAQIIKMVETAQNSKAPGQRIADKAAAWLVILAIGSGLATFFGWYFIAGATLIIALTFAVSTIVIACPDALGLATPTAVAVGTGIGAKHNILIKDAATLENTSKLTAIVLDKTGTLTEGKPRVTEIVAAEGYEQNQVLEIAAIVEINSNHPISAALIKEAENKKLEFRNRKTEKFEAIGGHGIKAVIEGKIVLAGTERLMIDNKVDFGKMKAEISRLLSNGNTISIVAVDGKIIGAVGIADEIKSTAKATVAKLQEMRIEVAMITGDHEEVAKKVANDLGINRYFAQVLPEDKAKYVKKLQEEGKFVAMVGDGINDAPALAQADIGIAIGAGTDVAIETGNIVLMKSDPYDIVRAIILSKATVAKMKQNLFWAAIYNVLAIPVAAGVFYTSFGISLRPEISALLMSASSIIVAINAVSLKRIEPHLKT
ncbi:MAG: copper-translocating P-type ATPase [Patescibacteria group bacterium]